MRRTNLYLDERQTAALDQVARAEGVSRAEVVRRLIDRGLASKSTDLDDDLAAIDASFGTMPEVGPRGREPDERAAHLDSIRRR